MTLTAQPPGDGATPRVVTITCDDGRAAGCVRRRDYETTLRSDPAATVAARLSAGAVGWTRLRRDATTIDICPVCASAPTGTPAPPYP